MTSPLGEAPAAAAAYWRALDRLEERGRYGIRLGLGRVGALLRSLGDPQRDLPGVLIGGTNGKGSVQAMVASICSAAGVRVGQTPKPHLVSYRERLLVDGHPIGVDDLRRLIDEVLDHAERVTGRLGPPTEFEVLTAAAFTWFARRDVRLGVIEVGLGGRLDATNVWDGGVAAITNVERDHMERLGDTLTAIGREKAAIIKRGDRAVTGATGEGLRQIRGRARRMGAPLVEVAPLTVERTGRDGLHLRHADRGPLAVPLLGRHQAANAAIAIETAGTLARLGHIDLSDEVLHRGLENVRWPGRMELLALTGASTAVPAGRAAAAAGFPDLLLDGAHNVAGMTALVAALDELKPQLSGGRPTLLIGMMRDKEVAPILERLRTCVTLRNATVVATQVDAPRSLGARELADAWRHGASEARSEEPQEVIAIADPEEARDHSIARSRAEDGLLLVCGSLYLVGAVRGALVDDPELRDPPRLTTSSGALGA